MVAASPFSSPWGTSAPVGRAFRSNKMCERMATRTARVRPSAACLTGKRPATGNIFFGGESFSYMSTSEWYLDLNSCVMFAWSKWPHGSVISPEIHVYCCVHVCPDLYAI